jgi:glyoxylase-like metal-dependent hydrolase (beta-lactamase superfamily II)
MGVMLPRMTLVEVPGHDIIGVRANNPGPFTLSGSNSWLVDRGPAWLIDPGPDLPEHVADLQTELNLRGGLGGIALTHFHADHMGAMPAVRELFPDTPVAAAHGTDFTLGDGDHFGPLEAMTTPGHAPDHLAFIAGTVAFTGDAVLGQGSVFVAPDPGALAGYLDGLRRLRARELDVIAPGHGPLVLDPAAKLDEYMAHRLDRERRLVEALERGRRGVDELLDEVWDDAPTELRTAAAVTLAAHLDKLEQEGRLPEGVERPQVPASLTGS